MLQEVFPEKRKGRQGAYFTLQKQHPGKKDGGDLCTNHGLHVVPSCNLQQRISQDFPTSASNTRTYPEAELNPFPQTTQGEPRGTAAAAPHHAAPPPGSTGNLQHLRQPAACRLSPDSPLGASTHNRMHNQV